jgi:hypothetical protein
MITFANPLRIDSTLICGKAVFIAVIASAAFSACTFPGRGIEKEEEINELRG